MSRSSGKTPGQFDFQMLSAKAWGEQIKLLTSLFRLFIPPPPPAM